MQSASINVSIWINDSCLLKYSAIRPLGPDLSTIRLIGHGANAMCDEFFINFFHFAGEQPSWLNWMIKLHLNRARRCWQQRRTALLNWIKRSYFYWLLLRTLWIVHFVISYLTKSVLLCTFKSTIRSVMMIIFELFVSSGPLSSERRLRALLKLDLILGWLGRRWLDLPPWLLRSLNHKLVRILNRRRILHLLVAIRLSRIIFVHVWLAQVFQGFYVLLNWVAVIRVTIIGLLNDLWLAIIVEVWVVLGLQEFRRGHCLRMRCRLPGYSFLINIRCNCLFILMAFVILLFCWFFFVLLIVQFFFLFLVMRLIIVIFIISFLVFLVLSLGLPRCLASISCTLRIFPHLWLSIIMLGSKFISNNIKICKYWILNVHKQLLTLL